MGYGTDIHILGNEHPTAREVMENQVGSSENPWTMVRVD